VVVGPPSAVFQNLAPLNLPFWPVWLNLAWANDMGGGEVLQQMCQKDPLDMSDFFLFGDQLFANRKAFGLSHSFDLFDSITWLFLCAALFECEPLPSIRAFLTAKRTPPRGLEGGSAQTLPNYNLTFVPVKP